MLRGLFANMQPVVKNLLIINVLFYLATMVLNSKGIFLVKELGLYYPDSYHFKPYQFATHFFMHDDTGIRHILFNMIALVVFGNMLERVWGSKRFLLFFFATAIGAAVVHMVSMGVEMYQMTEDFFPFKHDLFAMTELQYEAAGMMPYGPTVGASGAIYGLIVGAAMYFPNTQLYLYAMIPIKVKWLAMLAIAFDMISLFQNNPNDNTAHFAHLGGALVGFILVYFWRKNSTTFY